MSELEGPKDSQDDEFLRMVEGLRRDGYSYTPPVGGAVTWTSEEQARLAANKHWAEQGQSFADEQIARPAEDTQLPDPVHLTIQPIPQFSRLPINMSQQNSPGHSRQIRNIFKAAITEVKELIHDFFH